MFSSGKWAVAAFAVCMLAARGATAGVGFQSPSADELKMTVEPLAPGASAIILYRQVDRDDNSRTSHEDSYFRIKILTEEGRKHADVEIPFVKGQESIVGIRARTIRPDGSIANFDGKVYEKYLLKGKFEGRDLKVLTKTFTLPDVQVGGILEYSYTDDLAENTLFDSHWSLSDELFTRKAQFSLKPYKGMYSQWTLRWNWNSLPTGSTSPKEGPDHVVRMEVNNVPAFQEEDYMPPPDEVKSRVNFIYEDGVAAKDQASYWKAFGKKQNDAVESFVWKRKAMEQAVAEIVSASDSKDVKLRKLYDRVQQLRNTSYEVEKTEQEQKRAKEKTVENVNAEDIWKRHYGNGVQLTWLFLGLARAAGFEAYGCMVSDRRQHFFSPITMEGTKLDTNVVLIKLNGQDVYFDPGAAFTPFGLLTWSETGVVGLRLDKDGGSWIKTMLPEASKSRIEHAGQLKLSDTGDLEGKVTVTYTGLEGMYRRLEERNQDEVERKKFLEELLTSQIGAAAEVELTNKPDWASSETPLVAEFNLKIPGWAANAGRHAMIPAAIFTAAEKGMFEHANRVQPVYFEYPHESADDVTVQLPSGWQVSSVPRPQDQDGHVIRYTVKVEPGQGSLRLTRVLSVDFTMLELKYYPALRNFFEVVRAGDGQQIVLQPGEVHAGN